MSQALADNALVSSIVAIAEYCHEEKACAAAENPAGGQWRQRGGCPAAFAGELLSRLYFDRAPLPAIALTTDSSVLTAIGN